MTLQSDLPAIQIQNLSYTYNSGKKSQRKALNDISFTVPKGSFYVLSGPNGSGKTTLAKHLNGLLSVRSGTIEINGVKLSPKTKERIRKIVGLVFQNPEEQIFFPVVEEDVAFGPRNLGLEAKEVDKRVIEALRMVQSGHLCRRITFHLSFGEKKRIAIAGILALKPEILILDEPTAGLDPWIKPKIIRLLRDLCPKHTVLVVSHDLDVLKQADSIALLWDGSLRGVYDSYEDFYKYSFSIGKQIT